jgi:hypothetical protein
MHTQLYIHIHPGILAMLLTFALYGDTPGVEERYVQEIRAHTYLHICICV